MWCEQFGSSVAAAITWSSGDLPVATVDPATGLTTGASAGSAAIVATSGAITGSATLAVTPTPDGTPDPFVFADQEGVARTSSIISNTITVSGINTAADISITDGEYTINGGAYTALDGTVANGDQVTLRQVSSGSKGGTVETTLTIGGVRDTFTTAASFESSNSGGGGSRRHGKALSAPTSEDTVSKTIDIPHAPAPMTPVEREERINALRTRVIELMYQLVASLQAELDGNR